MLFRSKHEISHDPSNADVIRPTECLKSPSPIASILQISVFVPKTSSFLNTRFRDQPRARKKSYKPEGNSSYRTSTVDFRITRSRVNCLFGARIVAVGPYGRNAAKENADELNMTWNGIGCVMLNTRDTGRYSYGTDFRQDGPGSNGVARW